MDKSRAGNFLITKYTNSTLKPRLNNNFKVLIPEVNILLNSGKKILFFFYEVAGILILKIVGSVLFLKFERFKDS
jgi:hypothetical protein